MPAKPSMQHRMAAGITKEKEKQQQSGLIVFAKEVN
jgi:hypothetical protein